MQCVFIRQVRRPCVSRPFYVPKTMRIANVCASVLGTGREKIRQQRDLNVRTNGARKTWVLPRARRIKGGRPRGKRENVRYGRLLPKTVRFRWKEKVHDKRSRNSGRRTTCIFRRLHRDDSSENDTCAPFPCVSSALTAPHVTGDPSMGTEISFPTITTRLIIRPLNDRVGKRGRDGKKDSEKSRRYHTTLLQINVTDWKRDGRLTRINGRTS